MGIFPLPVENIVAAHGANAEQALEVPQIPLGLLKKINKRHPD